MAQLTRNQIINRAHRRLGVVNDEAISAQQLLDGIESLNAIIREEDQRLINKGNGKLWGITHRPLVLQAGVTEYTAANFSLLYQLVGNISELVAVSYRNSSGEDTPLRLVDATTWEGIGNKFDTGSPELAYFEQRNEQKVGTERSALNRLFVWRTPTTITTPSVLTSPDDGQIYTCIKSHISAETSNPGSSNVNWQMYWDRQGNTPVGVWLAGTSYTGAETLDITYKRPLSEFTHPSENPDMPGGWDRYLTYRLAYDLAADYGVDLAERAAIRLEYTEAFITLFPSTRQQSNSAFNKVRFF